MASTLSEVDEIRRYMAQIRHELHEDVQGVVKGAEATTDWRRYVKNYPWAAIGAAFVVGYLIVPRRQRPPAALPINLVGANPSQPVTYAAPQAAEPEKEKKGRGIVKTLFGLATPFLLRSAQGYASQYFEQYLAQKMADQQSPLANLAASFMNNGAGGPGGPGGPDPGAPRYPS